MGFHANDQWRVVTAGGERLEVNNSGIQVQGSVYLNNTNTRLVEGGGNALRIETNTGYIDIGSMNTGWIHFQGNRDYYFNRQTVFDANIRPYANNNRLLGTSAQRWSNVYAQLGNFAGNLDAGTFRDRDDTAYYVNPASTSRINNLDVISKRTDFAASSGWDAIGFGNATNLHMNGHNQFWFGAGNGTWFTGTANSKSQTSGLAADASQAHDLLISTMQGTSATDRGITFAVDTSGAGTGGWRLGKWHSGSSRASSLLAIDGTLVAKGGNTDEYDYYANDYSSYYNDGQPNWAGDSGAGWHKPSIVASSAIQIQSGNLGTNSRKPQIQFHQYGYGGPAIEYDGPNKKLQIGMIGTSTANRFNTFALKFGGNEAFVVNTDYASHNSDFRAPIFYDTNDTNYFGNFAGVSRINQAQLTYLGVGTAANTTGGYRINMGGSIDMNNNSIDYVTQLHFQDNVRFYDEGNDSYLNFKYGDGNAGGIRIRNGSNVQKGYLYADNGGFGLLDNDGNWAVRTQTGNNPLELRTNNNVEFQ
ncbi:MAG: hypothetical protein ACKVJK_22880, partial [Methylophagaceae bacterium]